MYPIFSRKTLISMTLWMGVFSLFPQTQAFSCWWNCCCCCHQEDPSTVTHKKPLINERTERSSSYGTTGSQPASLSQTPQQDPLPVPDSRLPTISERPDDSTVVTPLPSSEQPKKEKERPKQEERPLILASASSLGSSETAGPEWYDDSFSFPSTPSQKVWEISNTTFGDEGYPVTLGRAVTATFAKITPQICEAFTGEQETSLTKLLYKKVTHYALDGVQEHVRMFVTHVKALWEKDPSSFVFAYFPTTTSYYFFAMQPKTRTLYIKMQLIKGQNDEATLSSRPATRGSSRAASQTVSRASSRLPSPKREKDERKELVRKDEKSSKDKSNTGSDSD